MGHPPTPEQQKIIDAYTTGDALVIEAGAGTGKTTTLQLLADSTPRRRGLYIAYNKAIAVDAKARFPSNIRCATAHSLAFGAIGRRFKHRLDAPHVPAWRTAQILGIDRPTAVGETVLSPTQIARMVMETISRFCNSADPEPNARHIPRKAGLTSPEQRDFLQTLLVPLAQRAWADLRSPDGQLRFSHDCYLKMWQLSRPRLPYDVVYLDEAQDANPVIEDIVTSQHAQQVMVGDRCQAIYGWRGAVDAMSRFDAPNRLQLSQSFRFGPAVAAEANKWLSILGSDLRLTGFDRLNSSLTRLDRPDVVLCRSNAETIAQSLRAMSQERRVAIVGGGREVRALAEAAITLKAGSGTDHPHLFAFQTWAEVQDYAENDPAGKDLAVFVRLIDDYGPETVIDTVDKLSDERRADLVVSTAHKAKGREWGHVKIADDFHEPPSGEYGRPGRVPTEDAMLAYVSVTRARLVLDRGGLAWIDRHL